MITANQLKSGVVFELDGAPHMVESVQTQTPSARGGGMLYKIRARGLLTGAKTDLTCRGDDAFKEPDFLLRKAQFLYSDGDTCEFMDLETYDQYPVPLEQLEQERPYLTDDLEDLTLMLLDGRVVGVRLPDTVVLQLVECDPAVKGASATARTKPATTQTGLVLQVPEYMANGELVKVDTRTGKFLSRA